MQSLEKELTSLRLKTYRIANLSYETIENRHGFVVSQEFLLFFVDLCDRVTVMFS